MPGCIISVPMEPAVLIIGAGMAGLSCARELGRRGVPVRVFERSPGVGGRCATRRVDGQPVDHGPAFLNARSREFGDVLHLLEESDRLPGWPLRTRGERMAFPPDAYRPGRRRMAVRAGVSALPRRLARGLDVRLSCEVTALRASGDALEVVTAAGPHRARYVVVAGALPQSLRLVEPCVGDWPGAAPALERMRAIAVQPALTLIAGYPLEAPEPDFDIWHPLEATMLHTISNDSSKRDAPRWRVLVLQGRSAFSRARLEAAPESWRDDLLWEAAELLGGWAARPAWVQAHRWTSARVSAEDQMPAGQAFIAPGGAGVAVIGDAFACDPGLEGAYMSGVALAEQLARAPEIRAQLA